MYIAEAFGFRKVLDATFMIGFLVTWPDVTQADVGRYLAALRRAQVDIDLHPESFHASPPSGRAGKVPAPGRRAHLRHR